MLKGGPLRPPPMGDRVKPLQTIAAYLPCFGKALDKLQGKVVTHLEKLNGGEL